MESFISDLALILITAGVVTLLFKRLKQPVVLGYIVAGFLAGPHMPYIPSVTNLGSIQMWADLGVIFLMFTLGLEFSFKKIVKMGAGPVIAACSIILCMMSLGNGVGRLFGWSTMDSLFLGGMLAMSSTTIIYKAFDDLGLRQQKFAGEVLSVLILEDILGILLMVILSAMAVSRQFEGAELVGSLLKLGFFLILWFVVGLYVIPIFFRKARRWINRETLLVVSIGLCFLLVVMAEKAGYSAAFGAFMMGSILAETVEAEQIERVVAPVKDLFGAIFFVSVGMLVEPSVLAQYWLPILVLCLTIIVGQAVFGTAGFLLSGQPLSTAVKGGFSLAQIGEFAFILASLGTTLHVTSHFLYPVVVAVSILTTFCTPYMIKAAQPVTSLIERFMPRGVLQHLEGRTPRGANAVAAPHLWKRLLTALLNQVGAYLTLSIATILITLGVLLPVSRGLFGHWPGNAVCGLLTLLMASPFLRAIVMRKNHSDEWKGLRQRSRWDRAGLWTTFAVRWLVASAAIYYVLNFLSPLWWPWHVGLSMALTALIVASRRIKWASIKMERTFLQNLRSRDVEARREAHSDEPGYAGRLTSRNIHIASLEVPELSAWAGRPLSELGFGHSDGVMIAAIVRGSHRFNVPDGRACLYPGDRIEVIGGDESLQHFASRLQQELTSLPADTNGLQLRRLVMRNGNPFIGHALSESGLRERYRCMAVGFEDDAGNIIPAKADRTICRGDILWVVGERGNVLKLLGR